MRVQIEIGNIDLPTVIYFTTESQAYHPFEAVFLNYFSFVLGFF